MATFEYFLPIQDAIDLDESPIVNYIATGPNSERYFRDNGTFFDAYFEITSAISVSITGASYFLPNGVEYGRLSDARISVTANTTTLPDFCKRSADALCGAG